MLAILALLGAGQAYSFDRAPGRLPKDVVPVAYRVALTPDVASHTLRGSERISIRVRRATNRIVFNSLNETLAGVTLDGARVAGVRTENAKQLTTVSPARPLAPGDHVLAFSFRGKVETLPQGLFAQHYRAADGSDKVMLSTQMESTSAREMFPCWDEPAFRASFALTVTLPAAWSAVSNMPVQTRAVHGAVATTSFAPTPKMPSYLVELSAGDLAHIDERSGATPLSIWAVRGEEQNGRYALANAQQILADYNEYFGYPYPLPKLDSIAVPGGFQGAMENWGAITYNDQALLLPPGSTTGQRQAVYSIQAHEMAHQWNGDLVTMGWWDDIWLNESFASWMAAKETDRRNPDWHWWEEQDGDKEFAMNADARTTSHPIHMAVTDELQAEASADPEITYSKGQAFLRMLEAYLGPDTFRDGVRRYMKARAFSNATSADLWNALGAASGRDVAALASGWTEQPGFPLVSATSACDPSGNRTVTLRQARFLLNGADAAGYRWNVPLDVRAGTGGPLRHVLFAQDGQQVAAGRCDEPLSLNAGAIGYYRVAYDAPTLEINRKNFGALPDPEKIALLDDQWALARAGRAPLTAYLSLASSMGTGRDVRAWTQILAALGTLERDERGGPRYQAYLDYARSIVGPLQASLGWDPVPGETPDVSQLRRQALAQLGAAGDPAVLAEARKRFAAFAADRSAIAPDSQRLVMLIVAQHADQAAFDQLHAVAKSAKNQSEADRWYGALAAVRDPKLAQQVLAIAGSSEIPPQAAALPLQMVAGVGDFNPGAAWDYLQAHVDKLFAWAMTDERAIVLAGEVPQMFWQGVPLDDIRRFVVAHVPANAGTFVERGMERAQSAVDEKRRLAGETDAFLNAAERAQSVRKAL